MHPRREFLRSLGALAAAAGIAPAHAQAFPARPVRLIVPFPPGQAADIFARLLAEQLTPVYRQQVIVENRSGGGGVPGMLAIKDAAPDGYTWGVGTTGTLGVNPNIYKSIPYDALRDFAPASNIFIAPLVILAHPGFAPNSVAELVAAAKAKPGTINFASAGPGTAQHMTAELFKSRAGIDMLHVPYKGSGPAMTDLLGGQVPLMFDSLSAALGQIRGGRVKMLAVTTQSRVPQLPDVPTVAESGYAGFEGVGWSGIVLPKNVAPELVERISADIRRVLNEPKVRELILERGSIPDPRTPQQYARFIQDEIEKWGKVARTANVKLD
jgi:tripartite-type tricarboxylate transporter receptor subunit TctC